MLGLLKWPYIWSIHLHRFAVKTTLMIDFHKAPLQFCHISAWKTSMSLLSLQNQNRTNKQKTPSNSYPSTHSHCASQNSPSTSHIFLSGSYPRIDLYLEFLKCPETLWSQGSRASSWQLASRKVGMPIESTPKGQAYSILDSEVPESHLYNMRSIKQIQEEW